MSTAQTLGRVLRDLNLSIKAYWGGEQKLRVVVQPGGLRAWRDDTEAINGAEAVKRVWPDAVVSPDWSRRRTLKDSLPPFITHAEANGDV